MDVTTVKEGVTMNGLDVERQADWWEIFQSSALSHEYVERVYYINRDQLRQYLIGRTKPRKVNYAKMVALMGDCFKNPKPRRHPSYGFATQEEIKALCEMKIGPDYRALLDSIDFRNKREGKFIL